MVTPTDVRTVCLVIPSAFFGINLLTKFIEKLRFRYSDLDRTKFFSLVFKRGFIIDKCLIYLHSLWWKIITYVRVDIV